MIGACARRAAPSDRTNQTQRSGMNRTLVNVFTGLLLTAITLLVIFQGVGRPARDPPGAALPCGRGRGDLRGPGAGVAQGLHRGGSGAEHRLGDDRHQLAGNGAGRARHGGLHRGLLLGAVDLAQRGPDLARDSKGGSVPGGATAGPALCGAYLGRPDVRAAAELRGDAASRRDGDGQRPIGTERRDPRPPRPPDAAGDPARLRLDAAVVAAVLRRGDLDGHRAGGKLGAGGAAGADDQRDPGRDRLGTGHDLQAAPDRPAPGAHKTRRQLGA